MILEVIFMIENFIFKLGCSNSEKARLKREVNSRFEVHAVLEREVINRSIFSDS